MDHQQRAIHSSKFLSWQKGIYLLTIGPSVQLTFTVQVPTSVPWSVSGDSFCIQPFLFNGDASTWYYFDNIKYTNVTGTPSNPLTYQLVYNANQVTGNVITTASTTSKSHILRRGII